MYVTLFGPVDSELHGLKHLVFEPDGPMLQLPPSLLPASQQGVDAYRARTAKAGSARLSGPLKARAVKIALKGKMIGQIRKATMKLG